MKTLNDPKPSQGTQIWQHIETLQRRLVAACDAFDELYGYVYTLKAENRRRAEQAVAKLTRKSGDEQAF
jgi:hypothetical protein